MDNDAWHARFLIQAGWTKQLRRFLYQQVGINEKSRVLDAGCGTGVITAELEKYTRLPVMGLDVDFSRVQTARSQTQHPGFACADVYHLPLPSNSLDFVVSHFLFLWLKKPVVALTEMLRVLRPGGSVVALAEPDYLSRIDHPREFWKLGELQTEALINQGANPMQGRMLPEIFTQAGVSHIQYGVSGFQTSPGTIPEWFESEWKTLADDLEGMMPPKELARSKEIDRITRINGSRVLWVPTFYAFGSKA
jgi:ubiquinone/menaquinone biosynthesis C-methylase UbiE